MKIDQLSAEEIAERNKGEIAALDAFEVELASIQKGPRIIKVISCYGCVYFIGNAFRGGISAYCKHQCKEISPDWVPKMEAPAFCPFLPGELS